MCTDSVLSSVWASERAGDRTVTKTIFFPARKTPTYRILVRTKETTFIDAHTWKGQGLVGLLPNLYYTGGNTGSLSYKGSKTARKSQDRLLIRTLMHPEDCEPKIYVLLIKKNKLQMIMYTE